MEVVDAVAGLLLAAAVLLLVIVARRQLLRRSGAILDLAVRRPREKHTPWSLGVARYGADRLQWYRLFSLAPRPGRELPRTGLHVAERRRPSHAESLALVAGAVILVCDAADGRIELALAEAALPGLLAWLESAPPGAHLARGA